MADERAAALSLLQGLVDDPALRARFRADPTAVAAEAGLPRVARELASRPDAPLALEVRESRSGLAGVLMAAAVEGLALGGILEHAPDVHASIPAGAEKPRIPGADVPGEPPRGGGPGESAPAVRAPHTANLDDGSADTLRADTPETGHSPDVDESPGSASNGDADTDSPDEDDRPSSLSDDDAGDDDAGDEDAPDGSTADDTPDGPTADGDENEDEPDEDEPDEDEPDEDEHEDDEHEDDEDDGEDEDDEDDGVTENGTGEDEQEEADEDDSPLDSDSDADDEPEDSNEPDLPDGPQPYPGDDAPKADRAAWMAAAARDRGLPPELPVMASLVESGLTNLPGGDRDSVGYFQMRTSIWDQGPYAGYANKPERQLDWFLDNAEAVRKQRVARGLAIDDEQQYGEWIADVERPAAQYRGRYQEQLDEARALLRAITESADAQPAGPQARQALALVQGQLGKPYLWGGSTPEGWDCSGLVQWAYKKVGIDLPRVTQDQVNAPGGRHIGRKDLLPGDLVFFRDKAGDVHHVGISMGGDKFVHAPHTGGVVHESSLNEPYYREEFIGGRRFVPTGGADHANDVQRLPAVKRLPR